MKEYHIFKCKSVRFKDFLKNNKKISYIWTDVDRNNITYWLFDKDSVEFQEARKEYNMINNKIYNKKVLTL